MPGLRRRSLLTAAAIAGAASQLSTNHQVAGAAPATTSPPLTAYAAATTGDADLAARAWREFYTGHAGCPRDLDWRTERVEPPGGPEADRRDELCVDQRQLAVRPGRDPVPRPGRPPPPPT